MMSRGEFSFRLFTLLNVQFVNWKKVGYRKDEVSRVYLITEINRTGTECSQPFVRDCRYIPQ